MHNLCKSSQSTNFRLIAVKGSGLSVTQTASANQSVTNNISLDKLEECLPCLPRVWNIVTEVKIGWFWAKHSQYVMVHVHWWREVLVTIKWGKLHPCEHWSQTQIAVHSSRQCRTNGRQIASLLERSKRLKEAQIGTVMMMMMMMMMTRRMDIP